MKTVHVVALAASLFACGGDDDGGDPAADAGTGADAGVADAAPTTEFCDIDNSCPVGFLCAFTRDPHQVCGQEPPDPDLCGSTDEACIPPEDFGEDGATYIEGQVCLMRRGCIPRTQCQPCADDDDCDQLDGAARCVSIGGEMRCSRECQGEEGCAHGEQCTDDQCLPRYGACEDTGGYCQPCQDDFDCTVGDRPACVDLVDGERACLDLDFAAECVIDEDCPLAPSGLNGECMDEEDGVDAGQPSYQRCYAPMVEGTGYTCWAP
jgi:hypothetical protein